MHNCSVDSKIGSCICTNERNVSPQCKDSKKKSLNIIHRYSAPDILKFQRLTISAINSLPALIDLFHYMHKIPYIIIF